MTSIFPPSEAVARFASMKDWTIIMVGDKKTPQDWKHENVIYLSPENQEKLPYETVKFLPWNLPARVMLGYLYAIEHGAEIITQADDDNIPIGAEWTIPSFEAEYPHISQKGFVNIYQYYTNKFVWPRGYPLDKILEKNKPSTEKQKGSIGIWQHLANKETDVDAIYRLTNNEPIYFDQNEPTVLSPLALCPFNCQSTTFRKETFPLLYLPGFISPRESDIVRGLIAQPLMWNDGFTLGFTPPTVVQERNPHNYLKDFQAELLIYLHSEEIAKISAETATKEKTMPENLMRVYEALHQKGLVPKEELDLLAAWTNDIAKLMK